VAHEFNNIMTAILGFSEFLRDTVKDNPQSLEFVSMIETSAFRASKLTEGLLAYSRKQITNLEAVDINVIIKEVEGFLSKLMGPAITMEVSSPDIPLMVTADKAHLEQVLVNLSTNAIAAMPEGGTLRISSKYSVLAKSVMAYQATIPEGAYAVIGVSDTGMGIAPEIQDKIFEPFFTTKDIGKGTGLGLSVVYGIIRKHHGFIGVESALGKGTTFNIFLPLLKDVTEKAPSEKGASPAGGAETVLLAEDDDIVRTLLTQVLMNAGYNVIDTPNGDMAVRKFRESSDSIDLLLLDYAMPVRNGRAAYEAIRSLAPDVKVIFMSGYVTDENVRNELETSFPFLAKPVRPKDLLRMVREVLGPTPEVT